MIERLHPHRSGDRTARRGAPFTHGIPVRPAATLPGTPPPGGEAEDEPTILGFPAEIEPDDDRDDVGADGARTGTGGGPDSAVRLVVLRRADRIAGSALILAGAAANASLWLPWVAGESLTGMSLVRRGAAVAGSGLGELLRSGVWQPIAVVLGGGLLVLLGLLLFLPAHTHRLVGVLALLVALTATAAVLTLLAGADWVTARFALGMWFGVAVAGFGLLGALKAMLTLPLVTTVEHDSQLRR
jgi:hypothetical protein